MRRDNVNKNQTTDSENGYMGAPDFGVTRYRYKNSYIMFKERRRI